jgi:hypothetical protein
MALTGSGFGGLSHSREPFDRLADWDAVKKSMFSDARCWSQTLMDDLKFGLDDHGRAS